MMMFSNTAATAPILLCFLSLLFITDEGSSSPTLLPVTRAPVSEPCKADRLTVYKVELNTYWSRELFPKQYPEWRPNAQFSKVIGRSHNRNYVLWRLGSLATEGVKTFAENAKTDVLDGETQGSNGVYDEFLAPPVVKGVGKTEAEFFVDGNHSKVSLMARIVPSPDWFVGLDSFDLCVRGKWVDAVTLEVDPIDAGTDQGFTFTAPNWASEPREKIYRLTSQFPDHPANSFHYPNLKKLPPIATFTFIKVKEYELSQVFYHDGTRVSPQRYEYEEEATNAVHQQQQQLPSREAAPTTTTTTTTTTRKPININGNTVSNNNYNARPRTTTTSNGRSYRFDQVEQEEPGLNNRVGTGLQVSNKAGGGVSSNRHAVSSIRDSYQSKAKTINHKSSSSSTSSKERRGPRNCRVSEWSEWSSCSRSCGIGDRRRTRTIVRHARRGGKPCPNLVETNWCGSARCEASAKRYFDW